MNYVFDSIHTYYTYLFNIQSYYIEDDILMDYSLSHKQWLLHSTDSVSLDMLLVYISVTRCTLSSRDL